MFEPTINLCKNGFNVSKVLAEALKINQDWLSTNDNILKLVTNPISNKLYKTNEIIKFPQLAKTLEKISESGPSVFYNGEMSTQIVNEINLNGIYLNQLN